MCKPKSFRVFLSHCHFLPARTGQAKIFLPTRLSTAPNMGWRPTTSDLAFFMSSRGNSLMLVKSQRSWFFLSRGTISFKTLAVSLRKTETMMMSDFLMSSLLLRTTWVGGGTGPKETPPPSPSGLRRASPVLRLQKERLRFSLMWRLLVGRMLASPHW